MVHIKGVFRTVGLLDLLQGPSQLRHRLQQRCRNSSSSSRRRGRCGRAACNCGGGAVAQEEPLLQRCGRCLQLSLQRADTLRENGTFFEFSLCLSRACLGKIMHFIYKWRKSAVFLPPLPHPYQQRWPPPQRDDPSARHPLRLPSPQLGGANDSRSPHTSHPSP
jgi:hypothetical protein